jgi:outer membrane biosynthesis protein TonB
MKVNEAIVMGLALVVAGSMGSYAGEAQTEDTTAKPKVTVISGRGGSSAKIIEKDGTVRELSGDQLAFKNSANARLLEANDQKAQKLADEAKRAEEAKKPIAKKADDPKKPATATDDATADKKKANDEKKKAEDAEKKKAKADKAYNDKAYDFSGAPYVPEGKKKALSDITLESSKPSGLTGTPNKFAPAAKDSGSTAAAADSSGAKDSTDKSDSSSTTK